MTSTDPYERFIASLRARHEQWRIGWERRHVATDLEVLYHYTNAQGFLGIVDSEELWASNAAFLNDSTELIYIERVLGEVAGALRARHGIEGDGGRADLAQQLAGRTEGGFNEQSRARLVIDILESFLPTLSRARFDVYVSCFCSKGDLLSQWRGYPSGGGGYALGLRSASLARGHGVLRRVIYDRPTQRRLLWDLLVPIVDAVASSNYPPEEEGRDPWDYLVREHLGTVAGSMVECSFCFKHPGLIEESEWRLVILRTRDPKQRPNDPAPFVRATATGLLPYLTRSLELGRDVTSESPFAVVVVGPSPHPKLSADAAVQLLRNAGHEDAPDIVEHSAIPLRV